MGSGSASDSAQRCTIMTLPRDVYSELLGAHDKKALARMYGAK
jgi:hypothetical protein